MFWLSDTYFDLAPMQRDQRRDADMRVQTVDKDPEEADTNPKYWDALARWEEEGGASFPRRVA
ncbi:MAG: hypothetical protein AAFW65_02965 [Pseudomonadota bacterium]